MALNKVLVEDFESVSKLDINWTDLDGSTILVTGATGLIGSLFIRSIMYCANQRNINIKILAQVRNTEKADKIFADYKNLANLEYVVGDVRTTPTIGGEVDYIIHAASITASKMMIEQPVETLLTSVEGTKNMLELARAKKVKSFIYISSMEVYGTFTGAKAQNVTENDLGYINNLAVRSNYPESKRLCENMCIAYSSEYNVPVKIARLSQTFGAGILPGENRVFAQFARSAAAHEDIVLHTEGKSEGNYCYSSDSVKGLLTILLKGENGQAYNVVNPQTHTTIADMAKMVCDNFSDGQSKLVFDIPAENKYGYAADTKMKLNADKLIALGWQPQVDLTEAYNRLIRFMRSE